MSFKRTTFILLIPAALFLSTAAKAQDAAADPEQHALQLCYYFSNVLGVEMNALPDPVLFETIYEWLGTPYKYAGDCREGIDCSGFVCMLYQKVYGIELAASSAGIFKDVKSLKRNSMGAGDLVFFKIKKNRVSHVGIYLGNNKFAHASVQSGVIVSDLDEPYYKKHFFKGGRVKK
jgi:murein DD-endopeptidase / murein LD-carboxypeptidase